MVTIGVIKNSLFGGGGSNSPIPFGELRLIAKGTQNGIRNILKTLEIGDFVEGMKDIRFKWKSARYNGGDITNRANYTPLVEIDLENDIPSVVVVPPVVAPVPGVIILPTTSFYYESLWNATDTVHNPYINSWVDYIDGSGNLQHFILGGLENGCQLITASSILNTNGCATCVPVVVVPPVVVPPVVVPPVVVPPVVVPPVVSTCNSIISFMYKCSGPTTVTFAYLPCGATVETQVTIALQNTGGIFATYNLVDSMQDLCIENGSFRRVSGLVNVNTFIYSQDSCVLQPIAPVDPPVLFPTSNFYFEGRWLSDDTIHRPELNSWVDYIDAQGNIDRFIIGGIEGGCQLIVASSILGKSGCNVCAP